MANQTAKVKGGALLSRITFVREQRGEDARAAGNEICEYICEWNA